MPVSVEERRAYDKNWYARQSRDWKERRLLQQRQRKAELRSWLNDYKSAHPCRCGESHPACLEFHHTADDKEINVADAITHGWSLDRIKREIGRCVLICANCHRKEHWNQGVA